MVTERYFGFWPVEVIAQLADWPTGSQEVARGGCLFAWNFSVTRSTLLMEADKKDTRPDMTLH